MKNTKMLLLVILIVIFTAMVLKFWSSLMLFLLSAIIAFLLVPIAGWMHKKLKVGRGFAIAITLLLFGAVIISVISLSVPKIATELGALVSEIQRLTSNLDQTIEQFTGYLEKINIPQPVINTIAEMLMQSDKYIAAFLSSIVSVLVSVSLRLFDIVIVSILVVYFMLDGRKLINSFIATLPKGVGAKIERIVSEANLLTWRYIKSRVVISAGMAVTVYVGLTLLGMKYALLFALLSFVLDFVPYFGSIVAGVVQGFFAFITGGIGFGITVVVFVTIVQQIEGNIIAPKVQGDLTGIHPITVMFSILACNQIWGPVGMLISVPIAAILKLIFKEMYMYIITPDSKKAIDAKKS